PDTSQVCTAIEHKTLMFEHDTAMANPSHQWRHARGMQLLSLDDFVCPGDFSELHRFVTVKKPSTVCSSYYLLERKPFDPNIFPADMARLTSRIQRLVVLLQ